MIEAKDLRIGNIVNDEDLQPMYIAGLWPVNYGKQYNFIDSANNTGNINLISGIPLTEEWLVKFGFEIDDLQNDIWHFKLSEFAIIEFADGSLSWEQKVDLNYIHELQNIYYMITGQELTLKQS